MQRMRWVIILVVLVLVLMLSSCYTVMVVKRRPVHRIETDELVYEEEEYEDVIEDYGEYEDEVVHQHYLYGDLWSGHYMFDPYWSSPYWWSYNSWNSWSRWSYYDPWVWDPWWYGYGYGYNRYWGGRYNGYGYWNYYDPYSSYWDGYYSTNSYKRRGFDRHDALSRRGVRAGEGGVSVSNRRAVDSGVGSTVSNRRDRRNDGEGVPGVSTSSSDRRVRSTGSGTSTGDKAVRRSSTSTGSTGSSVSRVRSTGSGTSTGDKAVRRSSTSTGSTGRGSTCSSTSRVRSTGSGTSTGDKAVRRSSTSTGSTGLAVVQQGVHRVKAEQPVPPAKDRRSREVHLPGAGVHHRVPLPAVEAAVGAVVEAAVGAAVAAAVAAVEAARVHEDSPLMRYELTCIGGQHEIAVMDRYKYNRSSVGFQGLFTGCSIYLGAFVGGRCEGCEHGWCIHWNIGRLYSVVL